MTFALHEWHGKRRQRVAADRRPGPRPVGRVRPGRASAPVLPARAMRPECVEPRAEAPVGQLEEISLERIHPEAAVDATLVRVRGKLEGVERVGAAPKEEDAGLVRQRGFEGVVLERRSDREARSEADARAHEGPLQLLGCDPVPFDVFRARPRERRVLEREDAFERAGEPPVPADVVPDAQEDRAEALLAAVAVSPEEEALPGERPSDSPGRRESTGAPPTAP